MKTLGKVAIGAAVLSVTLAGIAIADSDHGAMHGPGMGMGMQHGAHGAMRHGQGMEEHLTTLKSDLKLTAKQEPAWQAFEQTVRNQKATHEQGHGPAQAGTDPMESHIAFMEQRLAGMKAVSKARQDLYKVLTPEQKTTADSFFSGQHA
jgi:protein CpxP